MGSIFFTTIPLRLRNFIPLCTYTKKTYRYYTDLNILRTYWSTGCQIKNFRFYHEIFEKFLAWFYRENFINPSHLFSMLRNRAKQGRDWKISPNYFGSNYNSAISADWIDINYRGEKLLLIYFICNYMFDKSANAEHCKLSTGNICTSPYFFFLLIPICLLPF